MEKFIGLLKVKCSGILPEPASTVENVAIATDDVLFKAIM